MRDFSIQLNALYYKIWRSIYEYFWCIFIEYIEHLSHFNFAYVSFESNINEIDVFFFSFRCHIWALRESSTITHTHTRASQRMNRCYYNASGFRSCGAMCVNTVQWTAIDIWCRNWKKKEKWSSNRIYSSF